MRATKGPLLQVSKGPVAGASPRATKQRHGALLALVLVLLAASALLLVRQGSAGSGGGEAAGQSVGIWLGCSGPSVHGSRLSCLLGVSLQPP